MLNPRAHMNSEAVQACTKPYCFFCVMNEPNSHVRRTNLAKCFREMVVRDDDEEQVLVLSCLWSLAMNQPNDSEFPSLGIFECMSKLIHKGVSLSHWLLKGQNIYIPYYAAHIIGSYTMNKPKFAQKAASSGVIPPLLELLRGEMSWVEQRVAVRALGHLATHDVSFNELVEYEDEIMNSCMNIASNCLKVVYTNFVQKDVAQRLKYHSDVLTRGIGGVEVEDRKAEEWASQLQCWSLSLMDCFVKRQRSRCIESLCNYNRGGFIRELSGMWGGLVNKNSPCGIGLLRSLCDSKTGRMGVASSKEAVLVLCNSSRSSDDWQYMAIETLLLILKDPSTRYKVIDPAIIYLKDLVEVGKVKGRKRVGDKITQVLLQDYGMIKYGKVKPKPKLLGEKVERGMDEVWDVKVEKRKKEKLMSENEIVESKSLATKLKKEGNDLFWGGDVKGSFEKYTKALTFCPLRYKKERVVLHSNRAQCCLLLKDPKSAISDATKAICLSGSKKLHAKSLWRRSQAYDIMGLAKESLMDCLLFINCDNKSSSKGKNKRLDLPQYTARLISKQIRATWLFAGVDLADARCGCLEEDDVAHSDD